MGVITLPMGRKNQEPVPAKDARLNVVAVLLCLVPVGAGIAWAVTIDNPWPLLVALPIGFTLALSPRVAKQWERAIVLRLGPEPVKKTAAPNGAAVAAGKTVQV